MDLISVIVPVYKVEKYLERCVQSIVDQTYQNLEIILVDDGSPDNSPALCDVWAAKDSRIKVIHKPNGGGGEARNMALDAAKGDLIAFVDSDDYISPYMFAHLRSLLADDVDIAECSYTSVCDDRETFACQEDLPPRYFSAAEAMAEHIADRLFCQVIWNKLYRREMIGDIRFPVGTRIDDEFFTYRVLANAGKLVHSDRVMYAYRQQQDSVMHLSFSLPRIQAIDAKCQRMDLVQARFPELVAAAKCNLWFSCLYLGQMTLLHIGKGEQQTAFKKLQSVLAQYPMDANDKRALSAKERLWLTLAKRSFKSACTIRNLLKIGF